MAATESRVLAVLVREIGLGRMQGGPGLRRNSPSHGSQATPRVGGRRSGGGEGGLACQRSTTLNRNSRPTGQRVVGPRSLVEAGPVNSAPIFGIRRRESSHGGRRAAMPA